MKRPKPIIITLTTEEVERAHAIARAFGGIKFKGQSELSRLSEDPQYIIDYASACGRIAWIQRYLDLWLDTKPSRNGDRGYHSQLADGRTLDVKTTRTKSGPLVIGGAMPGMQLRTDIVCLAEVDKSGWDGRTVKLAGWITATEFRKKYKRRDMGHGVREVVGQMELSRDFEALKMIAHNLQPSKQLAFT